MLRLNSLVRSSRLVRFFNTEPVKPLNDRTHILKQKGKGSEDIYFNKKEKDALKSLLSKLEDAETAEVNPEENSKKHQMSLLALARQHNLRLTEVVIDDLVKWRKGEI